MDKFEEYLKLLPEKPNSGIYAWLEETGAFNNKQIVYRLDEKNNTAHCICLRCNTQFEAAWAEYKPECMHGELEKAGWKNTYTGETVWDYEKTICPHCKEKVEAHRYRSHTCFRAHCMIIENVENRLILTEWNIYMDLKKDFSKTYTVYPKNAYIIDGKRMIRATGHVHGTWCKNKAINSTWAILSRYDDVTGNMAGHIYPFSPDILQGTSGENSKLDIYINSKAKVIYPVSYLYLYLKHNNIENLIMQGMSRYVSEAITDATERVSDSSWTGASRGIISTNIQCIDWKKTKPYQMLKLSNKQEFEMIQKNKIGRDVFIFYQEHSSKIKIEELRFLQKYADKKYGSITGEAGLRELFEKEKQPMKAVKYLLKKNRKKYMEKDARYLLDYWGMAENLKYNMKDTAIKYPRSLQKAHDNAFAAQRAQENALLDAKIAERYNQLKKYCYKSENGLEIHPATTGSEFAREGAELSHCVSTYTKRYADGRTAIFFIRHSKEPDKPYFTLELDEQRLTVRQNRGHKNCARTQEVTEFEAEWLDFIKKVNREERQNGKRNNKAAA